jgi:hypothetical protein
MGETAYGQAMQSSEGPRSLRGANYHQIYEYSRVVHGFAIASDRTPLSSICGPHWAHETWSTREEIILLRRCLES